MNLQLVRSFVSSARRMVTCAAFGSWESPITPDVFAKGNCKSIVELHATKDGVFWIEQSNKTGERELYFKGAKDHAPTRWAPGHSVTNSVHEYGGGSFLPTPEGGVVFTTKKGLYEQETAEAEQKELASTLDNKFRFADFSVTATHVYCVNEIHEEKEHGSGDQSKELDFEKLKQGDPENRLISIDRRTLQQKDVAHGSDFYSCPRVSPNGKKIVWMQWNHINMPWDATQICIADVREDGSVGKARILKDGEAEGKISGELVNYHCPMWAPTGELYVVHDRTGFWNVYTVDVETGAETAVYPTDKYDIGNPQWQFADRAFATNGHSVVLKTGEKLLLRTKTSDVEVAPSGFSSYAHLSLLEDGTIYTIAGGPRKSSSVLRITNDNKVEVCRQAIDEEDLAQFDISEPEKLTFNSSGVQVSGYLYMPKNSAFEEIEDTKPPVILMGHGGPTGGAWPVLDLKKQFFTSRGFAIFDVDYRGSTGYGAAFRNMLKGQWGVVDRDDMIAAAQTLISKKLVDEKKVCITGSSAGGYLLLSVLIHSDIFKAAVSVYGVADLIGMCTDTHKFERGYNEALIGRLPKELKIYEERSPILHYDKLSTPTAFLHGKADPVVPFQQSVDMYEALKKKGISTALQLYDGEGHGFRGAEAIRKSTEATYYFLCKALGIKPSVSSDLVIDNL